MFGTILKPTTGITPEQVGALVEDVASCPLFCFVKEDENLYPRLDYSLASERTRRAIEAIQRVQDRRAAAESFSHRTSPERRMRFSTRCTRSSKPAPLA
jgi:ribulose 1,5-bisphosphate carboxylase large subunit-like protein